MEAIEFQKGTTQKMLRNDDNQELDYLKCLLSNNDHLETNKTTKIEKSTISDSHAAFMAGIPNEVLFYQNTKWISE